MTQQAVERGPRAADRVWSVAAVLFVIAALVAPIFAHGCHGGDEDHEPLMVPHVEEK